MNIFKSLALILVVLYLGALVFVVISSLDISKPQDKRILRNEDDDSLKKNIVVGSVVLLTPFLFLFVARITRNK